MSDLKTRCFILELAVKRLEYEEERRTCKEVYEEMFELIIDEE